MLEYLLHREISILCACVCGEKNELRNDVERSRGKGLNAENAQICASNTVGKNLHLTPIETLVVCTRILKAASRCMWQPNRSACKIDFKFPM
jgi:hypothetical protein